jgi:drug/metabolite transporter (DMT)-like permease
VPHEEKRAWILGIAAIASYAVYLVLVLGRAGGRPLAEVPYAATLLWTVGASIVATIVLSILAAMISRDGEKDLRDHEISRFGGYVGHSFVVIGAVAALLLALAEAPHFWIANAVYLCFTLSAILGSVARIFAYRRGFQPW